MKRIFSLTPADDQWLRDFYDLCRCGLFHDGMTRGRVVIENEFPLPLEYRDNLIVVSPNKFLDAISADFSRYLEELKDQASTTLRSAFERASQLR